MCMEQVLYKGENYHLYLAEKEYIYNPMDSFVHMVWPSTDSIEYENAYRIDERNIILESALIRTNTSNISFTEINSISPKVIEDGNIRTVRYDNINLPLNYTGALIILKDFIDKYGFEIDYPCYCYRNVIELIFNDGCLITTIDHSRAMLKIRKNIDAGLRNPKVKKDIKCINRFIKSSFIGEYKKKNNRMKRKIRFVHLFNKKKSIQCD